MEKVIKSKWTLAALVVLGLWLGIRYLLPVVLPFLLGGALALAAEPLVRLASRKLNRPLAAGLGISGTLVLMGCVVVLLGALAVKELSILTQELPDVQATARNGIARVHSWLDRAVQQSPESVRGLLQQTVDSAFSGQTSPVKSVAEQIPEKVTDVLMWLPRGAVTIFTALVSAFMISARLPKLKEKLRTALPQNWREKYLPALGHIRRGLWGWLKAQLKLMGITWGILSIGFLLLNVDYGFFLAALIALVDAVPVLGTGTVLVPWSLVCFLQGNTALGIGLLGIYGVALTVRTVLEPRFVGRQLGLDPLLTLVAFYTGFTLWGFLGMLMAPVLAAAIGTVAKQKEI